ncbi:MAG: type II and III secretion system protein [Candidatus Delongbacteria bacterium]|nr:type II and III secretion system protein [Candidatus Delongbacteria bacterium]
MTIKHIILLLTFTFSMFLISVAQNYSNDSIRIKLERLSEKLPELKSKISVSVEDLDMRNFLRAIANNSKINLNIDPKIDLTVTNNFSDVVVIDLLIFICEQYNLEIELIGNIINIKQGNIPEITKPEFVPKMIPVSFDSNGNLLSFDINNDTLELVIKEISKKTGKNIVITPETKNMIISGYVQNEEMTKALNMLAFANNFIFEKNSENDFYVIKIPEKSKVINDEETNTNNRNKKTTNNTNSNRNNKNNNEQIFFDIVNHDEFNIYCENSNLEDIIKFLCDTLKENYFITTNLNADISLNLTNASFEIFLQHVFSGLNYSYIKKDNIYLFGDTKIQELRIIKNIQLLYRSVENIDKIIPSDLKKELEIKEFLDLNSLLVSGPIAQVSLVERFIKDIDKLVPVVLIEVIVVDISKSANISTGITFGTTTQNIESGGSIFPGIDYTLNANSINNILSSFDGFGTLNLGRVNSNFYMNLKALESNGNIKIRSTPQLATLNGHEANLTIGNTTYYKEQKQDLAINQSTTSVTTVRFMPVKADLTIKIKPVVSGDEQITLEVEVKQSDFGARTDPDAPPDQVSREFKSTIRVKNQEMILLGGLEEKSDTKTSSGLPGIARVPVLKWFFSSRINENKNSKLSIFIKPTVIN